MRRYGGTNVGIDGHFHAEVTTSHGCNGTEQKGDGRKDSAGGIPARAPGHEDENEDGKDDNEPKADTVFCGEEGLGTFVNGLVDFLETCRFFLVVAGSTVAHERLRFAADAAVGNDRNARNQHKLTPRPCETDRRSDQDDLGCVNLIEFHARGKQRRPRIVRNSSHFALSSPRPRFTKNTSRSRRLVSKKYSSIHLDLLLSYCCQYREETEMLDHTRKWQIPMNVRRGYLFWYCV